MSDTQLQEPETGERTSPSAQDDRSGNSFVVFLLSAVAALAVPFLLYISLKVTLDVLSGLPDLVLGAIAILIGVVGIFAVYTGVDKAIKYGLPPRLGERVRPYAYVGPAMVLLTIFLIYPAVDVIATSFGDSTGRGFIGFDNYIYVLTDAAMLRSLRNTLLWILVVPTICVAIGLGFAVLADKLKRFESLSKSLIFLPMAISFVGAAIVWRFVYSFRLEGSGEQIGIINGIWTALGNSPVDWLGQVPWNNFLLMVIMIWLQTGFAMVILSAAIKGVSEEILEAARIDGANEIQIFWQVVVPSIKSSIVVVFTTMVIGVLKVFDIVWVMTGGQDGTEVIAERMIRNMFTFRDFGRGAAVAVFMFLAVIPVMIVNVRRFREEEALR
jgi:alpha-glucoside transport system permease protein